MRVVTISASYGAGGSIIAPLVAKRLGVPFLDRGLSASNAVEVGEAALSEMARPDEDVTQSIWSRILEAFAAVPDEYGTHLSMPPGGSAGALRAEGERVLLDFINANDGGVVLGFAGALVLDNAFRVRLDGPESRRLERAVEMEGIDSATAKQRMEHSNKIRCEYWRRLYQRDIRDPAAYQLMIDSTLFEAEYVADMIADASQTATRGHD